MTDKPHKPHKGGDKATAAQEEQPKAAKPREKRPREEGPPEAEAEAEAPPPKKDKRKRERQGDDEVGTTPATSASASQRDVFLQNCPANTTEEEVRQNYAALGKGAVESVRWMMRKNNTVFSGKGFVTFRTPELAQQALRLPPFVLRGKIITAQLSEPKRTAPRDQYLALPPQYSVLHLGGAPPHITNEYVISYVAEKLRFPQPIHKIRWMRDEDSGRFSGVGFVHFVHPELAERVLRECPRIPYPDDTTEEQAQEQEQEQEQETAAPATGGAEGEDEEEGAAAPQAPQNQKRMMVFKRSKAKPQAGTETTDFLRYRQRERTAKVVYLDVAAHTEAAHFKEHYEDELGFGEGAVAAVKFKRTPKGKYTATVRFASRALAERALLHNAPAVGANGRRTPHLRLMMRQFQSGKGADPAEWGAGGEGDDSDGDDAEDDAED